MNVPEILNVCKSKEKDMFTLEHTGFKEKNLASSIQESLYTLYYTNPERLDYNITLSLSLNGNLNKERLQYALNTCLKINLMLTAKFFQIDGILYYKVRPDVQMDIEYVQYGQAYYDD